jgi:hypothetical protein
VAALPQAAPVDGLRAGVLNCRGGRHWRGPTREKGHAQVLHACRKDTNNSAANRLLSYEYRKPYKLPE